MNVKDMHDTTRHADAQSLNSKGPVIFAAVSRWTSFLQGKASADEALGAIAACFETPLAVLSKVTDDPDMPDRLAVYDAEADRNPAVPLDRSFAREIRGANNARTSTGAICLCTMRNRSEADALSTFHRCRNLVALAVIPLETHVDHGYFLELHLPIDVSAQDRAALKLIAPMLSKTWRRKSACFTPEDVLPVSARGRNISQMTPLLSAENPARLSRAEYRVCLLLSGGKTIDKAREELGVTMTTIRSHLKNVYAKTNTSCHSELLYRLLPMNKPRAPLGQDGHA